ncbi:MAG: hypothetical protein O2966_07370 [Proteobacteria bacterium]|nr:hypothetical protein [Pseudomonadota bacterium]
MKLNLHVKIPIKLNKSLHTEQNRCGFSGGFCEQERGDVKIFFNALRSFESVAKLTEVELVYLYKFDFNDNFLFYGAKKMAQPFNILC